MGGQQRDQIGSLGQINSGINISSFKPTKNLSFIIISNMLGNLCETRTNGQSKVLNIKKANAWLLFVTVTWSKSSSEKTGGKTVSQ
jgi:hypothetical protein